MMLAVAIAVKDGSIAIKKNVHEKVDPYPQQSTSCGDILDFDLQTYVAGRHCRVVFPFGNCLFGNYRFKKKKKKNVTNRFVSCNIYIFHCSP